ncbi:MAG: ABC transporter substrate-binding protein, partial [Bacteroidota bacterium]
MKRITILCSLLLAAALGFSSYAYSAPTTINYWTIFTGPDGATMQKLVDAYNAENKGKFEVRMSIMPSNVFYEKIVAAVISNSAPDVAIMHVDRVPEFAARGALLELDKYVKRLGLKGADYIKATWDGGLIDGKRYSIPLDTHPLVMYWNKKLFREAGLDPNKPPADAASFLKAAKLLTKDTNNDGQPDQWGTQLSVGWPNFQYWYSILYQNGGDIFNKDCTKAVFNSPEGVNALQYLVDLIYKERVSPANVQVDADVEAFKRGEVGMEFNGIWMLNAYKERPGLEFGAGVIPQWGAKKLAIWGGSHQFVIPKMKKLDNKKVEASIRFVKWLGDHSLEWGLGGQLPARLKVLNSKEFRADPYLGRIADAAQYVVFPKFFTKYGEATGPIWDAINKAFLNKATAQKA